MQSIEARGGVVEAMGAGFLALKTPTPLKNALRSLANHTVFGAGLYVAAAALAGFAA